MMDDIRSRNLTVRLSRLTATETSASAGHPPASAASTSSGHPRSRPRTLDLSRISHAHRPTRSNFVPQKRGRGRPSNQSKLANVKIKMNFFKKRTRTGTGVEKGSDISIKESRSSSPAVSIPKSKADEGEGVAQKNSEPSSSDRDETPNEERDDSSWADDFDYRPVRAAAVAALEAVAGRKRTAPDNWDSEANKLRLRSKVLTKQPQTKGRSRRTAWKRSAIQRFQALKESQPAKPRVYTSQSIFHDDIYFQRGDIVSVVGDDSNDEDEEPYFCQITGFIVDQMNKSQAALSWLVPKPNAPCIPFSPRNYTINDDIPLSNVEMDDVEFVMHCPHDYYNRDYADNFKTWSSECPTVYQRLGEPLVLTEVVPITDTAVDTPSTPSTSSHVK